ncbi:hypothetical protein BDQ12DRAFT_698246 [Crucibulum laeve]|uniref:DUF6589 domain-containing protein n=1 Tax=Crucibulum laeve TaxID=68775 RepID=A0A5C3M1U3_9AGAR|nr:hypothetical protein BDQ12DRAFT_698246 [Crucibulum laeve]
MTMEQLKLNFVSGLFDGIRIKPGLESSTVPQKVFEWEGFEKVTTEDRLLVVIRSMRQAGFALLGLLLAALFDRRANYNKHTTVYMSISKFLQCQSIELSTHPLAIVDMIYHHKYSQNFIDRRPEHPHFTLPRYAQPPSLRLRRILSPPYKNTTHNALLNWSLLRMIDHVDKEASLLVDPQLSLVLLPSTKLVWDMLLKWSATESQEKIATEVPALFALLSTIAVNKRTCQRLETAATGSESAPHSPDLEGIDVAAEDSDSDMEVPTENQEFADTLSGICHDPWLGVTITVLVLLFFQYRFAIVFATLMGVFLFTCNANRDIISVFGRLGFSISHKTILAILHVLAVDSDRHLRFWGAATQSETCTWRQVLGRKDEVQSGTAATLIGLEDVPAGAMRSAPLLESILQMLLDNIEWDHIQGVGMGTVLRIWVKHVPALAYHRDNVESLFTEKHQKHALRLCKSKIFPMRPTNIDEATTAGAASVLKNLVLGQLHIMPTWMVNWIILICGDQLSVDRVRKLKCYTAKTNTPYDRHDWALPLIQLWHMKWNWQKAIFRLHWWPEVQKGLFGLHHDCEILEREKFNAVKCDFYPAHHILEDRFEALVLHALRLICEEKTGVVKPPTLRLLESLEMYFTSGGPLADCTFIDLSAFAATVYQRYMCSAAYDDALGHTSRSEEIYGPSKVALPINQEPMPGPSTQVKKAAAAPTRNYSQGDQSLLTTINFMRMTFWYLEMCAATAEGDIGRVFEVVKLLRFSFWGAGSTNYGNELLELACNFLYEFSDDLCTAVLNNYLVNPSGRTGHCHDFDSKHLSEAIGLNIRGFSALREVFPSFFGLKHNSHHHTKAKTMNDIDSLAAHYRADHILTFVAGHEFAEGYNVLIAGQLEIFKDRTLRDGPGMEEASPESREPDSDFNYMPTTPITISQGVTDAPEFISGE